MERAKQLFDFLSSRGARKNCPLCGHEDWDGWDERVKLPHVPGSKTIDRETEVFPLTCTNCGSSSDSSLPASSKTPAATTPSPEGSSGFHDPWVAGSDSSRTAG